MALKTASTGYFAIPTAPSDGVTATTGPSGNDFGSYVQLLASTSAAIFITHVVLRPGTNNITYFDLTLATGGSGSETAISTLMVMATGGTTQTQFIIPLKAMIPVATSTRIAVKAASNLVAALPIIGLIAINQANVVDAGIVEQADVEQWKTSVPDALSSGKVPADLKLWLATAPAAVSTNGYVQSMLMRWLTDNAGGTPSILNTNRVDADANLKTINSFQLVADSGTAQGGSTTSITLRSGASSVLNVFQNMYIYIDGGTGKGQIGFCTAYNGTTKVATVNAWSQGIATDSTSTYTIIAF